MKPLVSCVVPVFNGERYLAEALDSIISQNYHPIEIIVVDDGSTDGSAEVAAGYGNTVTYVCQVNAGPAAARNTGIKSAKGEYLAFLDADDIWVSDKLERQLACLEARPEIGICAGHYQNFWAPELKEEEDRLRAQGAGEPQPGTLPSMLIRRSVFDTVGLLNQELKHRDSMEWLGRAKDAGIVMETLPGILIYRRLHSSNISREEAAADPSEMLWALKERLDRQRK